ncbi:universal stress protein [Mycolicibacterium sp.]|uniref:universal stress protein n=1 Tax=Mycolicibacterium sp. TaxID=2320850 RepID=UPI003D103993
MLDNEPKPCVVVGIDGSPTAVEAALWAVDEAAERDIPLRLVHAIEPTDTAGPDAHAAQLAAADAAVHRALAAVEACGRPVKTEVDIVQERPVQALLEAARWATLLCVGARGHKHATSGRIGSTAACLAIAAPCPVAVVRNSRPHSRTERAVVIEATDPATVGAVLRRGFDEARRRGAPVRLLTPAQHHADVQAQWERRLAEWRQRYPELDITSISIRGDVLDYLAAHADAIALVVADRGRPGGIGALVGAPGNAALRDRDCSILVCEPTNAL